LGKTFWILLALRALSDLENNESVCRAGWTERTTSLAKYATLATDINSLVLDWHHTNRLKPLTAVEGKTIPASPAVETDAILMLAGCASHSAEKVGWTYITGGKRMSPHTVRKEEDEGEEGAKREWIAIPVPSCTLDSSQSNPDWREKGRKLGKKAIKVQGGRCFSAIGIGSAAR